MTQYTSKQINRDWRMKVDATTQDGKKLHTLMGVSGVIALIGEDFLVKFLDRAYASMEDSCTCKLRRGIVITFYSKKVQPYKTNSIMEQTFDSKKFSRNMDKAWRLIYHGCGDEHPALETIIAMADMHNDDEYKFDETIFFYLLRELMNWDFFWCTPAGKVDVKNANRPELARLIAPFVTPEMGKKALATF